MCMMTIMNEYIFTNFQSIEIYILMLNKNIRVLSFGIWSIS